MARKKVKLSFITNDSSRKATFKKRKKGLLKKVNELSTLCGTTACAIIYSPYDANPEVWPSNDGARKVVSDFKSLPEMDQQKKMVDQEAFMRQRIAKASDHLRRQRKDNREIEMSEIMKQSLMGNMKNYTMNILDLNDLGYTIDQLHKDLTRRIEVVQNSALEIGESSHAGGASEGNASTMVMASTMAPLMAPMPIIHEVGSSSSSAALNRPIQQPHQLFHYQSAPQSGPSATLSFQNLNLSLNHNQNQQQWFMGMDNHPQTSSHATGQIGFPFMDHNQQQHQPQPHQQTTDDSTNSAALNPNNDVHVTNPNLTNNIWFH